MEHGKISPKEVVENFFDSYRNHDLESIESLCCADITYVNPEGLVSNGKGEFLELLEKEFDSFGVLFEPISWEVTVERTSFCFVSWKRGMKIARKAAFRRVEVFGSALVVKADDKWQLMHFQHGFTSSYAGLLKAKKK